eukprot:CAMPEP_0114325864 /NCGR_PEP_ID=MMETSP0059-20121206/29372_1 /TAXON_ID=36894 /ORGANISM="Pyramimonas parkeae, Strain CCMP726" /LENGTH=351 /DNA_ID=CAMNT_0001454707 /DNA_START=83 /DNA_END=1135 /DNA_ORIENTATION=+
MPPGARPFRAGGERSPPWPLPSVSQIFKASQSTAHSAEKLDSKPIAGSVDSQSSRRWWEVEEAPGQLRAELQASAGAVAGAFARCIVAPLDVVKIRLQVQLDPVRCTGKYSSVLGTMATIFKEEGLVGLWRGTLPAVLFWMPYTAVQFAVLERSKQALEHSRFRHWDRSARAVAAGAAAGAAATLASYPLDVVRTNVAAQGPSQARTSMAEAQGPSQARASMAATASSIVMRRGWRGLYAGLAPTLLEILPHSGIQFGSYDAMQRVAKWARRVPEEEALGAADKFACGLVAGSVAKAAIHPLDVVKKRFQVAGLSRCRSLGEAVTTTTYSGVADALRKIAAREGARGLFKG